MFFPFGNLGREFARSNEGNDAASDLTGITGTLVVDVGAYHAAWEIIDKTNDMVNAVITEEQLQSMIAAHDRGERQGRLARRIGDT